MQIKKSDIISNSFKMKNFIYIVIIVILSIICIQQCRNKVTFKNQLKQNQEARKDTIEYYKNELGQTVAEKKAFQTSLADKEILIADVLQENQQLKNQIASFKKPTSASSTDIKVEVKDVQYHFKNPVNYDFSRKFTITDKNYSFYGEVNQFGINLNFLATNRQTLATGLKKRGWFSSYFTSEATNSNDIFTITDMTNINFQEKPKRFGLSVFTGYGVMTNFQTGPVIGVGISYDLFRF